MQSVKELSCLRSGIFFRFLRLWPCIHRRSSMALRVGKNKRHCERREYQFLRRTFRTNIFLSSVDICATNTSICYYSRFCLSSRSNLLVTYLSWNNRLTKHHFAITSRDEFRIRIGWKWTFKSILLPFPCLLNSWVAPCHDAVVFLL